PALFAAAPGDPGPSLLGAADRRRRPLADRPRRRTGARPGRRGRGPRGTRRPRAFPRPGRRLGGGAHRVRPPRAGEPPHRRRAPPHSAAMRDRLNRGIKYREEFRPFAPAVPLSKADRFFDLPPGGARLARFMSGVFPVRPEWRDRLAAVTHVDGTARVQTVDP